MDQQELEQYEHQLSQVEIALDADPSNTELASLQSELKELIDLTKQAISLSASAGPSKPKAVAPKAAPARATPEGSASPSTAARSAPAGPAGGATTSGPAQDASKFKIGDEVVARYTDGRFYPARILSQTGPAASPTYSVSFTEYASSPPSTVPLSSLRLMAEAQKRKADREAGEREKEKKKLKSEKWKEIKESKNQVQVAKQQGWQSFAKKATKKGLVGVKSESMFKTPDAVHSKVGVTGSGRGTTDYGTRKKHKFAPGEDE